MKDAKIVAAANAALKFFAPETRIEVRKGGVYILWTDFLGIKMSRRWTVLNQSFYPVWYRHWAHGGTCCVAMAQLIRWIQGKPVVPLVCWQNWCGDHVGLARARGGNHATELLQALREGGYPEHANCVLCGVRLTNYDWWCLDGVSGPCCNWTEGCRQEGKEAG